MEEELVKERFERLKFVQRLFNPCPSIPTTEFPNAPNVREESLKRLLEGVFSKYQKKDYWKEN